MKPICKEYYRLSKLPNIQWTIGFAFHKMRASRLMSAQTLYTPVCVLERLEKDEEDWFIRAHAVSILNREEKK